MTRITIATRGSKLALVQARWTQERLMELSAPLDVDLLIIKTKGDKILDTPLAQVGGKGLFVKEIEEAVLAGQADLAVHSIKDMPTEIPAGLHLASVPAREDRRDVLISSSGAGLMDLPPASRIGSSSLRRRAQILAVRPDLQVVSLRGNVDTRLRKLDEGQVEAVVLAAAGLKRLGILGRATEFIDSRIMLPAVGQGALGLECRREDLEVTDLLAKTADPVTEVEIRAERAFLARLEGGCQVPIACAARLDEKQLSVEGLVADLDGRSVIRRAKQGPAQEAENLGRLLADEILDQGGREILAAIYHQ